MYCVIKCIVRGNQARVKNADLRHPSCTVVMYRRKSASPVHNVLKSGSLSLLEPSGSVQVCNGIALPLHQSTTCQTP